MSRRRGRNIPASVHARLRQLRQPGQELNPLLQRYIAERFLYRLGASGVADRFILKGASLFFVWNGDVYRGTQDIDLLAKCAPTYDEIRRALDIVCAVSCAEDGVVFDPSRTKIHKLPVDGVARRCDLAGTLGNIKLPLQVDIGFGDTVTPSPVKSAYPTLLDHPQPIVWIYPRESLIAEKFAAMVVLGRRNSRIKDVWDIAALAISFAFQGPVLQQALRATLEQHDALDSTEVAALEPTYYGDRHRQELWSRFCRRVELQGYNPNSLGEAGTLVCAFLKPVWGSIVREELFPMVWLPGGPWRVHTSVTFGRADRR